MKNENYTKLIEDDEEFERQEVWLEECQDMFINLDIQGKKHLETLAQEKDDQQDKDLPRKQAENIDVSENNGEQGEKINLATSVQQGNKDSSDPSKKKDDIHNNGLQNQSKENSACGFTMQKPKMPKFSGDVRDYAIFRADFKHAIESRYSKRDAITFIRTCLQGKLLDLIKGIGTDYTAAWEYLDSIYGDSRVVSDTVTHIFWLKCR